MMYTTETYPWHKSYCVYGDENDFYRFDELLKELVQKWYDYGVFKKIFHRKECINEIEQEIIDKNFNVVTHNNVFY